MDNKAFGIELRDNGEIKTVYIRIEHIACSSTASHKEAFDTLVAFLKKQIIAIENTDINTLEVVDVY